VRVLVDAYRDRKEARARLATALPAVLETARAQADALAEACTRRRAEAACA